MSTYVIGIGGTGAKIIESFIHISAAGLIDSKEKINLVFVDADVSNGNGNRALNIKELYATSKQMPGFDLHQTDIGYKADPSGNEIRKWSIIDSDNNSLKKLFIEEFTEHTPAEDLLRVLYSEEELSEPLEKGFKGHPNIGSLVITKNFDINADPWVYLMGDKSTILNEATNENVKIILCGSVFGGTGAAGIPTISKILYERFATQARVSLSCILMLPYFSFNGMNLTGIKAASDKFIENTKYALEYYHNEKYYDYFTKLYVIGDDVLIECDKASLGGQEQVNRSLIPELIASLAIKDCIEDQSGDKKVSYSRKSTDEKDIWKSLPMTDVEKNKLLQYMLFSLHYTKLYHPMLRSYIKSQSIPKHETWVMSFFSKRGVNIFAPESIKGLDNQFDYCSEYLRWLREMFSVEQYKTFIEVQLFDESHSNKIKNMNNIDYIVDPKLRKSIRYDHIYKAMNSSRITNDAKSEIGTFFNVLYDKCKIGGDK